MRLLVGTQMGSQAMMRVTRSIQLMRVTRSIQLCALTLAMGMFTTSQSSREDRVPSTEEQVALVWHISHSRTAQAKMTLRRYEQRDIRMEL